MVSSCGCNTKLLSLSLPLPCPGPVSSKSQCVWIEPCGTQAISSKFHSSSSLRKVQVPQELTRWTGCEKQRRRRELRLCAVAGLANVHDSAEGKVAGKLEKDLSWRCENVDQKKGHEPILYDNLDPPTYVYAPGRRIVAIGDVHGDLASTEGALSLAGVLSSDGQGRWVGGNTVFVQVGDILDRGEDEIAILSLLHNLGQQARLSGGAVFQVNGNHETMNIEGDYRFVDPGGFEEAEDFVKYCEKEHAGDYDTAFAGWYLASKKRKALKSFPFFTNWIMNPLKMHKAAAARALLFNPGGPIARKLSQHGVVLKLNDWLFAHGGILPHHVEYGLEKLNQEVTGWMRGDHCQAGNRQMELPFVAIRGFDSVVWSRLYSRFENNMTQDKIKACAILEATLDRVGAKALVVGHTPQPFGANCECKGRVWRIDVGMSRGVLDTEPEVLEINGNEAHVLRQDGCEGEENATLRIINSNNDVNVEN